MNIPTSNRNQVNESKRTLPLADNRFVIDPLFTQDVPGSHDNNTQPKDVALQGDNEMNDKPAISENGPTTNSDPALETRMREEEVLADAVYNYAIGQMRARDIRSFIKDKHEDKITTLQEYCAALLGGYSVLVILV